MWECFLLQSSGDLSHWSGQQQHLLQWLQILGAQGNAAGSSAWQKTLITDVHGARGLHAPWTVEVSPSRTWQAGGSSLLLLPRRPAAANFQTHVKTAWKKFKELLPVLSSRHLSFKTCGHVYSSCVWSNAPCQWDLATDKAKPPMSAAKWQGNDQTDLQCQGKTLSPPDPMRYLSGLAWFVCVEVLRPSQPNGVMSSAVSLPNHTFTGQA